MILLFVVFLAKCAINSFMQFYQLRKVMPLDSIRCAGDKEGKREREKRKQKKKTKRATIIGRNNDTKLNSKQRTFSLMGRTLKSDESDNQK